MFSAPKDQGSEKCKEACHQSLSRLGTEYLDLYLIHWPGVQGMKPYDKKQKELRQQSWYEMESLVSEGNTKPPFKVFSSLGLVLYTVIHHLYNLNKGIQNCQILSHVTKHITKFLTNLNTFWQF